MNKVRNVAILIFPDVELLDFCGPFEVFTTANHENSEKLFNVYAVSQEGEDVRTINGLVVKPEYSINNCPPPDILLIPGGIGSRKLLHNDVIIKWVQEQYSRVELMLSVCTGALVLAKAGLLQGLSATTHHTSFDLLAELEPSAKIIKDQKFVDNDKARIVVAAGISAGINMSLYILTKLTNKEISQKTAAEMEYDWRC